MRALFLTVTLAVACGGEAVGDGAAAGGTQSVGVGGDKALGGAGDGPADGEATGGAVASGGSPATADGGNPSSGGDVGAGGDVGTGGTESSGGASGAGGQPEPSGGSTGAGGTGEELSWEDPACEDFTVFRVRPGECILVEGSFYSGIYNPESDCFPASFSWSSCVTVTNETDEDKARRIVAKSGFTYQVARHEVIEGACPVTCAP